MSAARKVLDVWWERMLLLVFIGMQARVCKSAEYCPLWKPDYEPPKPTESDEEAEDKADKEAADKAVSKASAAKDADDEPGTKAVAQGNEELRLLRKRCNNALSVAAAIMAKDNMQMYCKLVLVLTTPMYDCHAENARGARSPEGVLSFYRQSAQGGYLDALHKVREKLEDTHILGHIGFSVDWARLKKQPPRARALLQADEDSMASEAWALACQNMRHRLNSMAWHSSAWPGKLALFSSPDVDVCETAFEDLRESWEAFKNAKDLSKKDTSLLKLVSKSWWSTRLLREVAEWCFEGPPMPLEENLTMLRDLAAVVFTGFGQTKVVEDVFNRLRDREERDVRNKKISLRRQWHCAIGEQVLQLHQREEIETPPLESTAGTERDKLGGSTFSYKNEQLSVDGSSMLGRATWPTFTPQAVQAQAAECSLMRVCHDSGEWALASGSWRCVFVPLGVVIRAKATNKFYMSLGQIGYTALQCWALQERPSNATWPSFRLASSGRCDSFVHALSFADYEATPPPALSALPRSLRWKAPA